MEFLLESITNVEVTAAHIWSKGWHRDQLCPWLLSRLQALRRSCSWMNLGTAVKRSYQRMYRNVHVLMVSIMWWGDFVFLCVCVNTGYICMWRSEVSLKCCSSGTVTLLFWDRVLHWPETHQVGKPAWPATPGIHLSLPPRCGDYGFVPLRHLFYVAFGAYTEVTIAGQTLD